MKTLGCNTHLKGKNPPTRQCAKPDLYHGTDGISREIFLVRHGASKPLAQFFPNIPPITVKGYPTEKQQTKNIK